MVIINWWHNLILFCALTLRVHSLCTSGKWNFRFANGGAFVCDATCSDTCIRHETTTNPYHLLVGASCAIIPKMLHATERCLPPKMTRISMTAAHIERCSKMVNKYAMRAIAPPHSHIHHSRIFWISLSIFDVFFSSSEWCTPKGPPLLCRSVVGSAYFVWSADFECLNAGEFVAELFCCSFFFCLNRSDSYGSRIAIGNDSGARTVPVTNKSDRQQQTTNMVSEMSYVAHGGPRGTIYIQLNVHTAHGHAACRCCYCCWRYMGWSSCCSKSRYTERERESDIHTAKHTST